MLNRFSTRKLLLADLLCALLVGASFAHGQWGKEFPPAGNIRQTDSSEAAAPKPGARFDCLPKDVQLNDVVTYVGTEKDNITLEKTLVQMKARCRDGKLVDVRRREIRFFRPSCWGNPPSDYLEIRQRENQELVRLKKRYPVIVFGCSPMTQ